jgi:hypothetical protein
MFKKIMILIPDVVNDVTYKHVKCYYEILYIMGYTNITKSSQICWFENIHTHI